jgi:uncharacterized protein (UPF0332 family)
VNEFERCLQRRGLVRFTAAGPDVTSIELKAAREDIADVDLMLDHARWKRATITGYYAMSHAARALVLARGYAEKSHYCLLVAFRELYGGSDAGRELAAGIERGRVMRENADYHSEFSEEGARAVRAFAERFVAFAEEHTAPS